MKRKSLILLVTILIVTLEVSSWAQKMPKANSIIPHVAKAVAPPFYPFVFNATGDAFVVVEVRINKKGEVTSAKTVDFSLFTDAAIEQTAKRWVFERSSSETERIARVKFVFRILPLDTDETELTTTFSPPYEIEVRSRIIRSPRNTSPLPIENP